MLKWRCSLAVVQPCCGYGNRHVACVVLRFCTWICLQRPLRSWIWLYRKKANSTQISTICSVLGNIVNFSHTSRTHFSRHVAHWKELGANAEKCQKPCQKQRLPLARGLPSNTRMPGPTPLTMPNDSSVAVHTSTQQCNKLPIRYNGMPQIHPPNCPFPFDDHHQNLIHPYQARPHSPPQTASGSNQPCCHCSHVWTDRWATWKFTNMSALLAILIEGDALKILG